MDEWINFVYELIYNTHHVQVYCVQGAAVGPICFQVVKCLYSTGSFRHKCFKTTAIVNLLCLYQSILKPLTPIFGVGLL